MSVRKFDSGESALQTAEGDDRILALFEALALEAGQAIMGVFRESFSKFEEKADRSPVTEADCASERIILQGLRSALPHLPVVSEEEAAAGEAPQDLGQDFILVDPLDGTREFISGNGDFTVNIALIRGGHPVLGVVYAPHGGRLYSGRPGRAEGVDVEPDLGTTARRALSVRQRPSRIGIVASRSHCTPETDAFLGRYPDAELMSVGSSLKFCMLAEGRVDLYPRFGRTMEWDTAAGDAVLRAAGGLTMTEDGLPLRYGKMGARGASNHENPNFVAVGQPGSPW